MISRDVMLRSRKHLNPETENRSISLALLFLASSFLLQNSGSYSRRQQRSNVCDVWVMCVCCSHPSPGESRAHCDLDALHLESDQAATERWQFSQWEIGGESTVMSQELLSSKNAWNISIGCVTLVLQAILECVSVLFVFRPCSDEWYLKQSLKMFNVRKHSQYCCHLLSTPSPPPP